MRATSGHNGEGGDSILTEHAGAHVSVRLSHFFGVMARLPCPDLTPQDCAEFGPRPLTFAGRRDRGP
jgi:hypothetical protein